ncbi:MAG TPA: TetR/AcrR family transcriptional regulator [Acidimicrobiales bacterium]
MAIDNRSALLKGARQCLEETGYARTTARDIAAAAGVSLGAIGYHFGSKEQLLNEAIAEGFRDWIASFAPLVLDSEERGIDGMVREAIPRFFSLVENNRPLLIAFFEALAQAEHNPVLKEQLAEQYRQSRAAAAEMFTRALGPQLEAAGIDAHAAGSLVLALVDGLITQSLIEPAATPGADDLLRMYDALTGAATGW